MSRAAAIDIATQVFDSGLFQETLARRVAIPSTSQEPEKAGALSDYLHEEMGPYLEGLGFTWHVLPNPVMAAAPFLFAERIEDESLPTLLTYGHCDTVQGQDGRWREGLSPWRLTVEGERWYGRGTADNKAQHTINLMALAAVLEARGSLGFNVKILLETGEEVGSPGLREFCRAEKERLKADLFIASDGPRVAPDQPTLFGGSRGALNFTLSIKYREGAHHSGNWGGLLANPGVRLAHALATMIGPRGEILVEELKNPPLSNALRQAIAKVPGYGGADTPEISADWGAPGTTPAERVIGLNALEILAFTTGTPESPVNAIPGEARATCQLRFTVDTEWRDIVPAVRRHLQELGFTEVEVEQARETAMPATRMDPEAPLMVWAARSLEQTLGRPPVVIPNLGGTIPNDCFMEILNLPTVWVPHSYGGCRQHAPDEHVLAPVMREALQIMAGLWWDLGAEAPALSGDGDID